MRTATLDLLDASLNSAYSENQKLPSAARFKFYHQPFMCDPANWDHFLPLCVKHKLEWQEYRYSAQNNLDAEIKSNAPGIYIFYIRPADTIHMLPRFALYVGISNEKNSKRALKTRLKEYHNYHTIKKRENIHQMLTMYHKNVWVAYSLLQQLSSKQMEQLEIDLHGFLYPPFGRRDFPAQLKKSQKAFGTI